MKERPILMSAPMVRAIIAGRKTQTRRVVKDDLAPPITATYVSPKIVDGRLKWIYADNTEPRLEAYIPGVICQYGSPGDRLWVKETFAHSTAEVMMSVDDRRPVGSTLGMAAYRATCDTDKPPFGKHWRPSIFMPRWASRITLEITEVRVQRLKEITEEDAWAEGCERGEPTDNGGWFPKHQVDRHGESGWDCARDWYADLWDEINGKKHPWALNEYVWAVSFTRL